MESAAAPRSRIREAGKFLAALFFSYHALAIFAISLPPNNPLVTKVQSWVYDYTRVTGTWQNWNMFTAVPRYHHNEFHIEARMPGGAVERFEPVLPGLRPVDGDVRNTLFLTRVMATLADGRSAWRAFREPYLQRVCRAIHDSGGVRPLSVALVLDAVRITPPQRKQHPTDLGRPSELKTDPFACSS